MAQAQPETRVLATAAIAPHPANPRKRFDEQALAELGASIQRVGLLEPLVVRISRRVGHNDAYEDAYELIAGERRWRAAKAIGLAAVPCRVLELDDAAAAEAMLAENLQRQDLTPMEEARAFQAWIAAQAKPAKGERPNWPKAMAERLGKSEDYVRERLALLALDEDLAAHVDARRIKLEDARLLGKLRPLLEAAAKAGVNYYGGADQLTKEVLEGSRRTGYLRARIREIPEAIKREQAWAAQREQAKARAGAAPKDDWRARESARRLAVAKRAAARKREHVAARAAAFEWLKQRSGTELLQLVIETLARHGASESKCSAAQVLGIYAGNQRSQMGAALARESAKRKGARQKELLAALLAGWESGEGGASWSTGPTPAAAFCKRHGIKFEVPEKAKVAAKGGKA